MKQSGGRKPMVHLSASNEKNAGLQRTAAVLATDREPSQVVVFSGSKTGQPPPGGKSHNRFDSLREWVKPQILVKVAMTGFGLPVGRTPR